jgi:hypothetical protein
MTNDSTNDKLLLIALREIMPISLSLLATQPSVTKITALWFDGPRPKMVSSRFSSQSTGIHIAAPRMGVEPAAQRG